MLTAQLHAYLLICDALIVYLTKGSCQFYYDHAIQFGTVDFVVHRSVLITVGHWPFSNQFQHLAFKKMADQFLTLVSTTDRCTCT